jgi:hypothetical protein
VARGRDRTPDFGDDLDRIIAGQQAETDARDEEYRRSLGFAGKVREARGVPPPEFQAALKARLLARLAEVNAARREERRPSFVEQLAALVRQRAWQVAGAVAVLVLALVVVWSVGIFSDRPVVTNPYPTVAVEGKATLDKESYDSGETIGISIRFTNMSKETLSFSFPPAFKIETPSAEMVRSFAGGKALARLAPGESQSVSATWDQKDDSGVQVPPGEYLIVMPNISLGEAGFLSLQDAPTIVLGR